MVAGNLVKIPSACSIANVVCFHSKLSGLGSRPGRVSGDSRPSPPWSGLVWNESAHENLATRASRARAERHQHVAIIRSSSWWLCTLASSFSECELRAIHVTRVNSDHLDMLVLAGCSSLRNYVCQYKYSYAFGVLVYHTITCMAGVGKSDSIREWRVCWQVVEILNSTTHFDFEIWALQSDLRIMQRRTARYG